jgi:hypothetical protein
VDTKKLQTLVNRLLTVQELRLGFGNVTAVTIHSWRHRDKLPTVIIPGKERPSIRFFLPDVQRWAKQTGRTIDLKALNGDTPSAPRKRKVTAAKGRQRYGRSGTAQTTEQRAA